MNRLSNPFAVKSKPNLRIARSCGPVTLLLVLFLLSVVSLARGSSFSLESTSGSVSPAGFAIADFDGDQQPDLATVQSGLGTSHESRYWIQFQFSTGSRQSFGISAPVGGLRLDSRDVNGDHFTDLIVSTPWLGQTVAIFLNDGHGKFTLAEPSKFLSATEKSDSTLSETARHQVDASGIPTSRQFLKVLLAQSYRDLAASAGALICRTNSSSHIFPHTHSFRGRAPPSTSLLA
jgi:hypothetical protein